MAKVKLGSLDEDTIPILTDHEVEFWRKKAYRFIRQYSMLMRDCPSLQNGIER